MKSRSSSTQKAVLTSREHTPRFKVMLFSASLAHQSLSLALSHLNRPCNPIEFLTSSSFRVYPISFAIRYPFDYHTNSISTPSGFHSFEIMGESDFMAHLEAELPLAMEPLVLPSEENKRVGLVIVDEVNGFCTVGAGNLAPQEPMEAVTEMVKQTNDLAHQFSARNWPIIAFLDTHQKDKPECPYPEHCIEGTGEENLVPELLWLERDPNTTLMRKDCINAFVGAIRDDGSNIIVDWIRDNKVQQILVVGICTDICVMDFVLTALSARNHGILKPLEDVFVFSEACATYHLPNHIAKTLNAFPHPQDLTHYMGLYFAKSRGAQVVNKVTLL